MKLNRTYYVVICRGDTDPSSPYAFGAYELATRTVFSTAEAAHEYARGVAEARQPLVVEGRWATLRWDESERFPKSRQSSP